MAPSCCDRGPPSEANSSQPSEPSPPLEACCGQDAQITGIGFCEKPEESEISQDPCRVGGPDICRADKVDLGASACCNEKAASACQQSSGENSKNQANEGESEDRCCSPGGGRCDDQDGLVAEKDFIKSSEDTCPDTCCSLKPDPETPECCRGKPSPCCDESCLDRLALRECDATDQACCSTKSIASCASSTNSPKRLVCDQHRLSIREQYRARLEALGCICRALLALGKESCCDPRRPTQARAKSCNRKSRESLCQGSNEPSCSSSAPKGPAAYKPRPVRQKPKGSCTPSQSDDSCCRSKKRSCDGIEATSAQGKSRDDCCSVSEDKLAVQRRDANVPPSSIPIPEAQNPSVEHVVLSVSGMTCTGCETKLNRTLGGVPGLNNLKTSLVLSRAEFDIDVRLVTTDYVVKHLERRTEFKCELLTTHGSSIDIVVRGDPSTFVNHRWPDGVLDMSIVRKDVVRVSYDPNVTGARDLVQRHWKDEATLAPLDDDPGLAAGTKHVRHLAYMTILSVAFTIPVLVLAWAPLPPREIAYASASLALATVVQVAIAGPFYPKALKALLFSRVIEMDLLIVLSTSAAYIFSVVSFAYLVAGKALSTGQFFETSTLLVTLIMVGRYVAALARQKAVESISMRSLQTQTALLVLDGDALTTEAIDVRLLQYGDTFKVLPETRIPTDGTVMSGSSEVDESMLTGEALPVDKTAKSPVVAGTVNGSGILIVQLNRLPGDNTITTIAAMVDEAKLSKPKMQELADRVASFFVPVVVGLTVITFAIWVAVSMAVQHKSGSEAAVQAITYAITVLIVSCPCAIGLAVPMVIVIASGIAAERGVVFKSANAIEVAHKTTHVVLDKTGTLTQGNLSVVTERMLSRNEDLSLLLGLIADSKHPVSVAVANHLSTKAITAASVHDIKSVVGKGVEGLAGGRILRAGNSRWLEVYSHPALQTIHATQQTAFCFSINGQLAAVFGLEDILRPESLHVVKTLQQLGISVHIVSGDDDGPVQAIACKLAIPASNTHSRSTPADKQTYVKHLLEASTETKTSPVVVFCGDGTNDAVALAQATIGVHMHQGSDVARSAADVVLMRPDLTGLLTMRNVSTVSTRRVKFNFAWAFVYNTFAVLLAAGAFVSARIPPEYAGLGELVSVLPVIAAAVLMRWSRI